MNTFKTLTVLAAIVTSGVAAEAGHGCGHQSYGYGHGYGGYQPQYGYDYYAEFPPSEIPPQFAGQPRTSRSFRQPPLAPSTKRVASTGTAPKNPLPSNQAPKLATTARNTAPKTKTDLPPVESLGVEIPAQTQTANVAPKTKIQTAATPPKAPAKTASTAKIPAQTSVAQKTSTVTSAAPLVKNPPPERVLSTKKITTIGAAASKTQDDDTSNAFVVVQSAE